MGESACLMQPFCYASGILKESSNQNSNPIHALGQSVSFGRFTSESLAWEKWSSFSSNSNRYVEEAERYSRPGSVAQKKAFFEAHYKRLAAQRAAALLEQQANNAAASNNVSEQGQEKVVGNNICDSNTGSPNSKLDVNEEQNVKTPNSKPEVILRANGYDSNSNMDTHKPESWKADQAFVESSKKDELQNQLENVGNHEEVAEKVTSTPPVNKWLLKQSSQSEQEILASISRKKPSVSFSMLLKENGTSKFNSTPAKSAVSVSSIQQNVSTPMSNKHALSSADKKNSTPKSVHKSMNFTPIRELNRLTASVMRRFENSRVAAASSKASKDNPTPLRTPTMASKNEWQKHGSMTPLTEKRSTKTPIDSSVSGSNTAGPKWRLLSAEKKPRSPIISSPFSLRTEERAARRKKKLEEKFNADETQKVQLHTKLKEKAETEIRKLRQSFCFKARPLPDFYKERKASKNEINKEPVLNESPKQGRKPAALVVESTISLPPQRPLVKNNGTKNFQAKNGRSLLHAFTSKSMMITPENTSPNIQLGNQNERTYKYNFYDQSITEQCDLLGN